MESLFETLTTAVAGATPVALAAAFAWGVLSILLSPCHLASIPLIVGFIQGQDSPTPRRALGLSSLFALGILVTIALIGVITAAAGQLLGDVGTAGNILVAVIFFVVGLSFLDVIPLKLPTPASVNPRQRGAWAALLLGLVFGIALGPCTFAYMAPMLGVAFKVATTNGVIGARPSGRLRRGSLPGDRTGRGRLGLGPAHPRLERRIPRRWVGEKSVRCPDHSRRVLPALHRAIGGD